MEILVSSKKRPKQSVCGIDSHKRGTYPFYSENLGCLVRTPRHRKQLMKEQGLRDGNDKVDIVKKKRMFDEEQRDKRRELMTKTFHEARSGKIDLRPMKLKMAKEAYEKRNGR